MVREVDGMGWEGRNTTPPSRLNLRVTASNLSHTLEPKVRNLPGEFWAEGTLCMPVGLAGSHYMHHTRPRQLPRRYTDRNFKYPGS